MENRIAQLLNTKQEANIILAVMLGKDTLKLLTSQLVNLFELSLKKNFEESKKHGYQCCILLCNDFMITIKNERLNFLDKFDYASLGVKPEISAYCTLNYKGFEIEKSAHFIMKKRFFQELKNMTATFFDIIHKGSKKVINLSIEELEIKAEEQETYKTIMP